MIDDKTPTMEEFQSKTSNQILLIWTQILERQSWPQII